MSEQRMEDIATFMGMTGCAEESQALFFLNETHDLEVQLLGCH